MTGGGLLTVPRADRKHAGGYECHASNGVGQICPFRLFIVKKFTGQKEVFLSRNFPWFFSLLQVTV